MKLLVEVTLQNKVQYTWNVFPYNEKVKDFSCSFAIQLNYTLVHKMQIALYCK